MKKIYGHDDVDSGIALINWSHLASGDRGGLRETKKDVFTAHWKPIAGEYGRYLCWLAFGVAAESIVRAAFQLRGHEIKRFGDDHPWSNVLALTSIESSIVAPHIKYLATKIRNRDAHSYVENVRDLEFLRVKNEFVPALNVVLSKIAAR